MAFHLIYAYYAAISEAQYHQSMFVWKLLKLWYPLLCSYEIKYGRKENTEKIENDQECIKDGEEPSEREKMSILQWTKKLPSGIILHTVSFR